MAESSETAETVTTELETPEPPDTADIFRRILVSNYEGKCTVENARRIGNVSTGWFKRHPEKFIVFENDALIAHYVSTRHQFVSICMDYVHDKCELPTCRKFHVCRNCLAGRCDEEECTKKVDFKSENNARIVRALNLETFSDGDLKNLLLCSTLQVCFDYNSTRGCKNQDKCIRLHLCKHFVQNQCYDRKECTKKHTTEDPHSQRLLKSFNLDEKPFNEMKSELLIPRRNHANQRRNKDIFSPEDLAEFIKFVHGKRNENVVAEEERQNVKTTVDYEALFGIKDPQELEDKDEKELIELATAASLAELEKMKEPQEDDVIVRAEPADDSFVSKKEKRDKGLRPGRMKTAGHEQEEHDFDVSEMSEEEQLRLALEISAREAGGGRPPKDHFEAVGGILNAEDLMMREAIEESRISCEQTAVMKPMGLEQGPAFLKNNAVKVRKKNHCLPQMSKGGDKSESRTDDTGDDIKVREEVIPRTWRGRAVGGLHLHTDDRERLICESNLRGSCGHGDGKNCQHHHWDRPYHWQVQLPERGGAGLAVGHVTLTGREEPTGDGTSWHSVDEDEDVEMEFCDSDLLANSIRVKVRTSSGMVKVKIHFCEPLYATADIEESMDRYPRYSVRRLSTAPAISSVIKHLPVGPNLTKWSWYMQQEPLPDETSNEIERAHFTKKSEISLRFPQVCFPGENEEDRAAVVKFESMSLILISPDERFPVCRRPVFHEQ